MAPRRILLLLPAAFGEVGGIQLYNRLLIKSFGEVTERFGSRCEILILNDRQSDLDARYLCDNVAVRGCDASKAKFLSATLAALLRFRPDLVVLGHINLAPLAVVCRPAGAHTWLFVHGIEFWRRLTFLKRLSLRFVTRIVSVSDFTIRAGRAANALSDNNFEVVPCALDPFWQTDFAQLVKPSGNGSTLLTVARLRESERYKGVDDVIRALPAIAARIPAVKYIVIGDGDDRPRLEALAHKLGVSDRVEFRGEVPVGQLAEAYGESAVYVMPSAKEGFGIVFLEAAFFRIPSVGARYGGIPEVIDEETGVLVEYGNVSQIASAVTDLLADSEKRSRLGAAARSRLEQRFSFAHLRGRLETMLLEATPRS